MIHGAQKNFKNTRCKTAQKINFFSKLENSAYAVLLPARVIYERIKVYENRIEFKTVEQSVFSERKIESIESFEAFRRGIRRAPLPLHHSDDL